MMGADPSILQKETEEWLFFSCCGASILWGPGGQGRSFADPDVPWFQWFWFPWFPEALLFQRSRLPCYCWNQVVFLQMGSEKTPLVPGSRVAVAKNPSRSAPWGNSFKSKIAEMVKFEAFKLPNI